jgi:SAM-dependent methyltransferase/pyrroloquinoline quinone (PQQ) biosynthesis protein C
MDDRDTKNRLLESLNASITERLVESHPFLEHFAAGAVSEAAIRWWAIKMLRGSSLLDQAFLSVVARIDDYRARFLLLRYVYSEHGNLNPEAGHVALYMRFMRGIGCPCVDVSEDDAAFRAPELRFNRFEIQDNEPLIWSLGRFAAIEAALPGVFTKYLQGLRKVFPGIDDSTIECFRIHCEQDLGHSDTLLQVASLYVRSEDDITTFADGARDLLLSLSDMFYWMERHMTTTVGTEDLVQPAPIRPRSPELRVTDRAIYGQDADLYDAIYYREDAYRREAAFVLDHLAGVPRPSLLDLCAGTGSHARLLIDRGVSVTGVDRSDAMLAIARRKVPEARLVQADIRFFSTDERFDAVICMYGALHYIEEPQDVVRVLRLALAHLRPSGVLIVDLREREHLPETWVGERVDGCGYRKFWLRRRGVDDSDLYAISAFNSHTGRHFLEVHNLFHTDPFRIANWARMTGFVDVRLHPDYRRDEIYERSSGENKVVLVGCRPGDAKDVHD